MKKYVLGPNAARKLKALLAKSDGVSRRPAGSSAIASDLEYAAPFTVKWAASANGGEGAWIIWLPSTELLVVDGEAVDVVADLEPAGGEYPDGWYVLDDVIGDDDTLYLDIVYPVEGSDEEESGDDAGDDDAPDGITAIFTNGEDDAESNVIRVAVCEVSTDSETGGRSVVQFVTSLLVIGAGGVRSLRGDDEDSISLDGDILIDGHKCGLIVKSQIVEVEGKAKAVLYLDVKGREDAAGCDNTDNWGCQPIHLPGGGLAHYLGCRPLDLSNIGGGGGGGGGGDDPDDPYDPDNPPGGGGDCVTSLNGEDGDLVLRLLEGWLEIVKGGQAKKAVGTVVTSVSGLIGDMAVIGGKKIRVEQEGNALKISYDDEKESEDENPFPDSPEVCSHPGGGGGVIAGMGGGGGGVQGGGGESGGGDSCCGGASATGGSATGAPSAGVSGKPATGSGGTNGKEITDPPSGSVSSGGKEAGSGLFNGSTIPKKRIEDTNTHGSLTDTKKMNKSPFASDPNWHGSIEETSANAKKPIYSGTHDQLTDTKKMNQSPFKRK